MGQRRPATSVFMFAMPMSMIALSPSPLSHAHARYDPLHYPDVHPCNTPAHLTLHAPVRPRCVDGGDARPREVARRQFVSYYTGWEFQSLRIPAKSLPIG